MKKPIVGLKQTLILKIVANYLTLYLKVFKIIIKLIYDIKINLKLAWYFKF